MKTTSSLRDPATIDWDKNSKDSAIDCSGPSLTRQEYAADADINNIINRFGIDQHAARQPIFGEIDFDRGLQEAFADIARANQLHLNLPPELRTKYPTRATLMQALENGQFASDLEAALKERNAPNLKQEITWLQEQVRTARKSSSEPTESDGGAAAGTRSATSEKTAPQTKSEPKPRTTS